MKSTLSARHAAMASDAAVTRNLQRAYELLRAGRLTDAEVICRSVLDRMPNHPLALDIFGLIAQRQDLLPMALTLFQKAVAADPRQPAFRQHLAKVYYQLDLVSPAIVQLKKALKLKPDSVDASCDLARCYLHQGKFDEALALARKLLAIAPDNPAAIFQGAEILAITRHTDEARLILRGAISRGIEVPKAYFELTKIERSAERLPDLDEVDALLGNPSIPTAHRAMLHSAAGRIAERRKLYDVAFEHFLKAKAPFAWAFDVGRHRKRHEGLRAGYTRSLFEDRRRIGSTSEQPVFIVGMPRSGTSLTEQILASHPRVAACGELSEMDRVAHQVSEMGGATMLSETALQKLAQQYLALIRTTGGEALRTTDKMPQNFLHLGLIAVLFPKAKIIHCRRDPLDNCLSCFVTAFPGKHHTYTARLETLGAYYKDYVALMDHWRAVLPVPIYDLQYEKLIAEPEAQIRALVDFVGLEWDAACLRSHETNRTVRTASRYQATEPINSESIGRWRRYERHLGPLKEALGPLATA
jgi:tetratricopeptide (TPR) repeat protein